MINVSRLLGAAVLLALLGACQEEPASTTRLQPVTGSERRPRQISMSVPAANWDLMSQACAIAGRSAQPPPLTEDPARIAALVSAGRWEGRVQYRYRNAATWDSRGEWRSVMNAAPSPEGQAGILFNIDWDPIPTDLSTGAGGFRNRVFDLHGPFLVMRQADPRQRTLVFWLNGQVLQGVSVGGTGDCYRRELFPAASAAPAA